MLIKAQRGVRSSERERANEAWGRKYQVQVRTKHFSLSVTNIHRDFKFAVNDPDANSKAGFSALSIFMRDYLGRSVSPLQEISLILTGQRAGWERACTAWLMKMSKS